MREIWRWTWTWLCLVGGMVAADTADAQERFRGFTWERPSAALGLHWANQNLGADVGGQAGYTLKEGIYVGGAIDLFFGSSEEIPSIGLELGGERSFWALSMGVNMGYDVGLLPELVVRPLLGLGLFTAFYEACRGSMCTDTSGTGIELTAGGQALYKIDPVTVGGSLRLMLGEVDAVTIGANVGAVL